jgi:hypothetical protein
MKYTQHQLDLYVEKFEYELSHCGFTKEEMTKILDHVRKNTDCPHFKTYVEDDNFFNNIIRNIYKRAAIEKKGETL